MASLPETLTINQFATITTQQGLSGCIQRASEWGDQSTQDAIEARQHQLEI